MGCRGGPAGGGPAAAARRGTLNNTQVWTVDTIMRDEGLLAAALGVVGQDHGRQGPVRYGAVYGHAVAFSWGDDSRLVAHVDGSVPEPESRRLVHAVETAYRRLVQQRTVESVTRQAPDNRLTVAGSHREPDGTMVLLLSSGGAPDQDVSVGVRTNGTVAGETHGFKGDSCLAYEPLLEHLTAARTVRSWYTAEYWQQEPQAYGQQSTVESEWE